MNSTYPALLGGTAVRTKAFAPYNTIGEAEKKAAMRVLDRGSLSDFYGSPSDRFYGGIEVRGLEEAWKERFGIAHAVSMNSATSALYAAIGALGLGAGDEVIVSPYTMSASATCPLIYGALPVFADIDPQTFGLDPLSVKKSITARTKAIVVVNIFGLPAALDPILALAREHGLKVIEDCAQSPGALYRGQESGSLGDIGVYSLNCHKTIQCGEGGIAVTKDADLAYRLQLIRNHAENIVADTAWEPKQWNNLVGFNYRLTELQAAIATEQLKKLDELNAQRVERVAELNAGLAKFSAITPPFVPEDRSHVYYIHCSRYDAKKAGLSRARFLEALKAEGIVFGGGYVRPLYHLPLFRKRLGFGNDGYPFSLRPQNEPQDYNTALCPVTEKMHFEELLTNTLIYSPLSKTDMMDVINGIEKVLTHSKDLQKA